MRRRSKSGSDAGRKHLPIVTLKRVAWGIRVDRASRHWRRRVSVDAIPRVERSANGGRSSPSPADSASLDLPHGSIRSFDCVKLAVQYRWHPAGRSQSMAGDSLFSIASSPARTTVYNAAFINSTMMSSTKTHTTTMFALMNDSTRGVRNRPNG